MGFLYHNATRQPPADNAVRASKPISAAARLRLRGLQSRFLCFHGASLYYYPPPTKRSKPCCRPRLILTNCAVARPDRRQFAGSVDRATGGCSRVAAEKRSGSTSLYVPSREAEMLRRLVALRPTRFRPAPWCGSGASSSVRRRELRPVRRRRLCAAGIARGLGLARDHYSSHAPMTAYHTSFRYRAVADRGWRLACCHAAGRRRDRGGGISCRSTPMRHGSSPVCRLDRAATPAQTTPTRWSSGWRAAAERPRPHPASDRKRGPDQPRPDGGRIFGDRPYLYLTAHLRPCRAANTLIEIDGFVPLAIRGSRPCRTGSAPSLPADGGGCMAVPLRRRRRMPCRGAGR